LALEQKSLATPAVDGQIISSQKVSTVINF